MPEEILMVDEKRLKDLILIQGNNNFQANTVEEIIKQIVNENYYEMEPQKQEEELYKNALAQSLGKNAEIFNTIEEYKKYKDNNILKQEKKPIILENERIYLASLINLNSEKPYINGILMLENKKANIFTKDILKKDMFKEERSVPNISPNQNIYSDSQGEDKPAQNMISENQEKENKNNYIILNAFSEKILENELNEIKK